MKVISYKRAVKAPHYRNISSYANIFYIPDLNVVLFKEQKGGFEICEYGLSNENMLKEAKAVEEDSTIKGIEICDIKTFDYNKEKLKELVNKAKQKFVLKKDVTEGIEELLVKIK